MSDHESNLVDGLLEHLQAVGGGWSSKLTMERLAFVKVITKLRAERDSFEKSCKELADLHTKADDKVEQLKEQATMRMVADAGIGTVPIGIKLKAHLEAEVERLKGQIKLNVDYATQCATVEKERDELKREHDAEVEQLKSMLDQIETRNDVATTPQAVELEELRQAHENCYAYAAKINKDRGSLKTEVERLRGYLQILRPWLDAKPDCEAGRLLAEIDAALDAKEAKKRG